MLHNIVEQLHDAIVFAIPFCLLVVTIEIFALDKLHGADTDRFGYIFGPPGWKLSWDSDTPLDARGLPAAAKV